MRTKGKKWLGMLLICLLIFTCCGCKSSEEKVAAQAQANWNQSTAAQRVSIYCALIKEYLLLVDDLGECTPYPAMKRSVKGYMMSSGLTQTEALEQAEIHLIEEEAVFWRAEQDGIIVTDEEVRRYIQENVISKVVEEEDYDTVSKVCTQEGISFEDTIWAYESSYKVDLIGEKSGIENSEEMEAYKAEAVERYKASGAYKDYQRVLDNCACLIRDNVTEKEMLRAAKIYDE